MNGFRDAVKAIPSIAESLRLGLQAMGTNSTLVRPNDPRKCEGSVDIDACFKHDQPNVNRWDYVVGYNEKAYFIEVHPASGQTNDVIAKCTWLKAWLKIDGAPLAAIHSDGKFHWLSTGGVNIIGKEKFRLAQNNIVLNRLELPPKTHQ